MTGEQYKKTVRCSSDKLIHRPKLCRYRTESSHTRLSAGSYKHTRRPSNSPEHITTRNGYISAGYWGKHVNMCNLRKIAVRFKARAQLVSLNLLQTLAPVGTKLIDLIAFTLIINTNIASDSNLEKQGSWWDLEATGKVMQINKSTDTNFADIWLNLLALDSASL